MKKILYIFLSVFISSSALANQPKDWQLGFQEAASSSMREIVNFHDKILLPIIIAISVFVLLAMKIQISPQCKEAMDNIGGFTTEVRGPVQVNPGVCTVFLL